MAQIKTVGAVSPSFPSSKKNNNNNNNNSHVSGSINNNNVTLPRTRSVSYVDDGHAVFSRGSSFRNEKATMVRIVGSVEA